MSDRLDRVCHTMAGHVAHDPMDADVTTALELLSLGSMLVSSDPRRSSLLPQLFDFIPCSNCHYRNHPDNSHCDSCGAKL